MSEAELRRRCWHESGHALTVNYLGGSPGPLSVKTTAAWEGVCFYSGVPEAPLEAVARVDVARPPLEWPRQLRDELEMRALVAAAGPAGELLTPPLPPEQGGPPIRVEVEPLLEELRRAATAPLEAGERELLARGDEPGFEPAGDLAVLFELGLAFYGDDQAADAFCRLQIVQARRLLELEELRGRRLSRLAEALAEHGDLSVAAVAAILTHKEEERWQRAARSSLPAAASSRSTASATG